MSYFKTSYSTLQKIALQGRFEDVAGFLVVARHASGLEVAGFAPYKLSGAGVNSVHEKACQSEESARGVLQRLQEGGFIRPASPETRKAFSFARWEVVQDDLDLDLPHALVDPLKGGKVSTPMRRIKESITATTYAPQLTKVSDTELRLDALMVLIGIYKHTDMQSYGGLNPRCAFRTWTVQSQSAKKDGFRWGVEPDAKNTAVAYTRFMQECIKHAGKISTKAELTDGQKARFWNAWHNITDRGLVYEAVSLFDADPAETESARLRVTLRVNDYHAGAISKAGDPSLLGSFESNSGTEFGFYTPKVNEREEPEAMWLILPDKRGAIVGIWRPRFRTTTSNVGVWLDQEKENIEALQNAVLSSQ